MYKVIYCKAGIWLQCTFREYENALNFARYVGGEVFVEYKKNKWMKY
jgi:hypothetical protein